jgi:hypothetical protein
MPADSAFELLEAFCTVDDDGQPHEVEVWGAVTYSVSPSGRTVRSVGPKHLRMAGSGNLVHSHLDGSLEDSKTGRRLRMGLVERSDAFHGGPTKRIE